MNIVMSFSRYGRHQAPWEPAFREQDDQIRREHRVIGDKPASFLAPTRAPTWRPRRSSNGLAASNNRLSLLSGSHGIFEGCFNTNYGWSFYHVDLRDANVSSPAGVGAPGRGPGNAGTASYERLSVPCLVRLERAIWGDAAPSAHGAQHARLSDPMFGFVLASLVCRKLDVGRAARRGLGFGQNANAIWLYGTS